MDSDGNLYITSGAFVGDGNANVIRKVTPEGLIVTVAGNGIAGYSGDGGLATSAALHGPEGIGIDSAASLFVADQFNQRIRKVSGGIITTVAGVVWLVTREMAVRRAGLNYPVPQVLHLMPPATCTSRTAITIGFVYYSPTERF